VCFSDGDSTEGKIRAKKPKKSNITVETNYLAGQIDADFLINLAVARRLINRVTSSTTA